MKAGLRECVQTAKANRIVASADAKSKQKKRRYSDGEASGDERMGDANYVSSSDENDSVESSVQSPRKKSKVNQMGDEEEDELYISPLLDDSDLAKAKRERRRRHATNFRDLAEDELLDSGDDEESGKVESADHGDRSGEPFVKTGSSNEKNPHSSGKYKSTLR